MTPAAILDLARQLAPRAAFLADEVTCDDLDAQGLSVEEYAPVRVRTRAVVRGRPQYAICRAGVGDESVLSAAAVRALLATGWFVAEGGCLELTPAGRAAAT